MTCNMSQTPMPPPSCGPLPAISTLPPLHFSLPVQNAAVHTDMQQRSSIPLPRYPVQQYNRYHPTGNTHYHHLPVMAPPYPHPQPPPPRPMPVSVPFSSMQSLPPQQDHVHHHPPPPMQQPHQHQHQHQQHHLSPEMQYAQHAYVQPQHDMPQHDMPQQTHATPSAPPQTVYGHVNYAQQAPVEHVPSIAHPVSILRPTSPVSPPPAATAPKTPSLSPTIFKPVPSKRMRRRNASSSTTSSITHNTTFNATPSSAILNNNNNNNNSNNNNNNTRGRRTSPNSSLPCDVCHQLYSRKDNLRAHQRVHSGEKPYQCSDCFVKFRWLGALRSHQASHRRRRAAALRLAAAAAAAAAASTPDVADNGMDVHHTNEGATHMGAHKVRMMSSEDRSAASTDVPVTALLNHEDSVHVASSLATGSGLTMHSRDVVHGTKNESGVMLATAATSRAMESEDYIDEENVSPMSTEESERQAEELLCNMPTSGVNICITKMPTVRVATETEGVVVDVGNASGENNERDWKHGGHFWTSSSRE